MSKRHLGFAYDFYNIVDLAVNRSMSKLPNLDLANTYIAIAKGWKNFESAEKRHRRNYVSGCGSSLKLRRTGALLVSYCVVRIAQIVNGFPLRGNDKGEILHFVQNDKMGLR